MPKDKTARKPRSDSKLKMLPADVQDALVQKLETGSLSAARAWLLAEHGVSSSLSALSSYLEWGKETRDVRSMVSTAEQVKELLVMAGLEEGDAIQKAGNIFAMLMTGRGDAPAFCQVVNTLRGWMETQSRIARADRKEQREDQTQQTGKNQLTPAERAQRQREILGVS